MEDLYKVAVDTATIFSVTDAQGTIINANDKFCIVSGYSRHEIIGQDHRLVRSNYHPATFYRDIWAKISQGSIWRGQICNKTKADAFHWISCSIIPIHTPETTLYISVSFEITTQITTILRLQWEVCHDSLTSLPNRACLLEHMKKRISTPRLDQRPFAIGMFDMNSFKAINDTYGHLVGDKLLIETARRLRNTCREQDTVARLGGDEFIILWDDAAIVNPVLQCTEGREAGEHPLRGILDRVFAQPFCLGNGILLNNVGGSLGIALYPDHGLDSETLLRNADLAMYQAKRRGGDPICMFDWGWKGERMQRSRGQ